MGCIYKITNKINNKLYIGYTTKSIEERMRKHRNDDIKYDTLLGRAIAKYGWENFDYFIIEIIDDKELLLEKEVYYIKHFNSLKPNGYNMTIGGEKMFGENNPFYGKTHSEETKALLSEKASERVGEKNPFYGKHHTEETKKKISEANSIKVAAIKDNQIIKTFNSATEAGEWCRELGLTKAKTPNSDILKCCKNKNKRAFGFYWEYIE